MIKFSNTSEHFSPSDLKVEVKNTTIGMLVEMLESEIIDLTPYFQRNLDLWSKKEKCELIESISLGIPLPSFYFYIDAQRKKWVIIDGLQRLCTLKSFFLGDLELKNLQFNVDLNGCRFSDFDFFQSTDMKMFPVTLNIFSGKVSSSAISEIFRRLNSQGTKLTAPEIRNAIYQGASTTLISEMVSLPLFKKLVSEHIEIKRMGDREYATRFLAFLLGDFESYSGNMDGFLGDAMRFINGLGQSQIASLKASFERSLYICDSLFGDDAFRIPAMSPGERRHPVSRAVFEMLSVSFARIPECCTEVLLDKKESFVQDYQGLFSTYEMKMAFMSGTASVSKVKLRFDTINKLIDKYI